MTREITHMKAFTAALESLGKPRFEIGRIPPTPILVDQFFNDSTGAGGDGEIDARGPWNEGGSWQFVEAPAFQDARQLPGDRSTGIDDRRTNTAGQPALLQDLLVQQLQDLLYAEGQLVKALPEMERAAASELLQMAFRKHLAETEDHVTRLQEALQMLDAETTAKPCKGMDGLIKESQAVIDGGADQGTTVTDLALIAAAQKVEHYEISAYGTARTMAGQIGQPRVAQLLGRTLAEEEVADNLLTQVARELLGATRLNKNDEAAGEQMAARTAAKKTRTKAPHSR
jgi:Mn-containing catalase